jgi:hypothetical protein
MTLSGFTLFHHPGKGWQMSTRREGQSGWSVSIIPDRQAEAVLSMLETSGHPDGPWSVKEAACRHGRSVNEECSGCDQMHGICRDFEIEISRLAEALNRLTEAIDGVA